MLIDKGFSWGDIITLKFPSGEEVIARLESEDEKFVKVEKPMVLAAGDRGIQLIPFIMTADYDTPIKIPKPVIMTLTQKESANTYRTMTSNITVA